MKNLNRMKHISKFNESIQNIDWIRLGGGEPKKNTNYLVTIYRRSKGDGERVVTIGSYNYNPFTKKYEWTHEERMIAYAELPNPFDE